MVFFKTERVGFPEIQNNWHPLKANELDLTEQIRVWQRVSVSTLPNINNGKTVPIKIADWPWDIPFIEDETTGDVSINQGCRY